MAYRKTESVIAGIEGRRAMIIASAIDIISKSGADALTTKSIAERSQLSVGLIYTHFPDMTELRTFVFAQMLARDLAVIRDAGNLQSGIRAWAAHLALNPRITSALAAQPAYRDGIRRELAKMIKAAGCDTPSLFAAVVCGAVMEAAGSLRPRDESGLVLCLLRAIGVRARATA